MRRAVTGKTVSKLVRLNLRSFYAKVPGVCFGFSYVEANNSR